MSTHEQVWSAVQARYSDPFFNPYRHQREVDFSAEAPTRAASMAIPVRGSGTHCARCGLVFSGTGRFDEHRVGDFPDGRRCLTPAEMTAIGMRIGQRGWGREWKGL